MNIHVHVSTPRVIFLLADLISNRRSVTLIPFNRCPSLENTRELVFHGPILLLTDFYWASRECLNLTGVAIVIRDLVSFPVNTNLAFE
jgi:hypothetical protein